MKNSVQLVVHRLLGGAFALFVSAGVLTEPSPAVAQTGRQSIDLFDRSSKQVIYQRPDIRGWIARIRSDQGLSISELRWVVTGPAETLRVRIYGASGDHSFPEDRDILWEGTVQHPASGWEHLKISVPTIEIPPGQFFIELFSPSGNTKVISDETLREWECRDHRQGYFASQLMRTEAGEFFASQYAFYLQMTAEPIDIQTSLSFARDTLFFSDLNKQFFPSSDSTTSATDSISTERGSVVQSPARGALGASFSRLLSSREGQQSFLVNGDIWSLRHGKLEQQVSSSTTSDEVIASIPVREDHAEQEYAMVVRSIRDDGSTGSVLRLVNHRGEGLASAVLPDGFADGLSCMVLGNLYGNEEMEIVLGSKHVSTSRGLLVFHRRDRSLVDISAQVGTLSGSSVDGGITGAVAVAERGSAYSKLWVAGNDGQTIALLNPLNARDTAIVHELASQGIRAVGLRASLLHDSIHVVEFSPSSVSGGNASKRFTGIYASSTAEEIPYRWSRQGGVGVDLDGNGRREYIHASESECAGLQILEKTDRFGYVDITTITGMNRLASSDVMVADVDLDGRPDIIAATAEGFVLWKNQSQGINPQKDVAIAGLCSGVEAYGRDGVTFHPVVRGRGVLFDDGPFVRLSQNVDSVVVLWANGRRQSYAGSSLPSVIEETGRREGPEEVRVVCWPNPVSESVTITVYAERQGRYAAFLVDNTGQSRGRIADYTTIAKAGEVSWTVSLAALPQQVSSGAYMVVIQDEEGQVQCSTLLTVVR